MLLRRQADREPSRKWSLWFFPSLGTKSKIILDRILKCLAKFIDRFPLKREHISNVDDFAMKDIRLVIKLRVS